MVVYFEKKTFSSLNVSETLFFISTFSFRLITMKSVTIFLALAMMVAVAESTVFITGGGLALAGLLGLKAALFGGVLIGEAASRRRHYRPSRKSYSRRYVC